MPIARTHPLIIPAAAGVPDILPTTTIPRAVHFAGPVRVRITASLQPNRRPDYEPGAELGELVEVRSILERSPSGTLSRNSSSLSVRVSSNPPVPRGPRPAAANEEEEDEILPEFESFYVPLNPHDYVPGSWDGDMQGRILVSEAKLARELESRQERMRAFYLPDEDPLLQSLMSGEVSLSHGGEGKRQNVMKEWRVAPPPDDSSAQSPQNIRDPAKLARLGRQAAEAGRELHERVLASEAGDEEVLDQDGWETTGGWYPTLVQHQTTLDYGNHGESSSLGTSHGHKSPRQAERDTKLERRLRKKTLTHEARLMDKEKNRQRKTDKVREWDPEASPVRSVGVNTLSAVPELSDSESSMSSSTGRDSSGKGTPTSRGLFVSQGASTDENDSDSGPPTSNHWSDPDPDMVAPNVSPLVAHGQSSLLDRDSPSRDKERRADRRRAKAEEAELKLLSAEIVRSQRKKGKKQEKSRRRYA
jgi:hypothetical protein